MTNDSTPDASRHGTTGDAPRTSRFGRSPALRWAVPVGAVVAIGAGVAFTSGSADAAAQLPPKTAAQLLVDLAKAPERPLSGTVVETAKLGLPELPNVGGGGTSLQSLVTGSHTARVWYGTDHKARVSLVGDLAETDVVRNGDDVWLWSSTTREARHYTVKEHDQEPSATPPAVATDPAAAAKQALAAIDPSTEVAVDGTGYVADRPVYELSLTPRDARSLVGSVRLAVDSETSVPLRVRVFARGGQEPAFETGFTDVQFQQPAASVFSFTPPPGAKVVQGGMPGSDAARAGSGTGTAKPATPSTGDRPNIVGKGWTSVAVLKGVDLGAVGQDATAGALLRGTTPVTGPFGSGRLLKTALVSVLFVGDTAYVGAVEPAVLEQAAATSASR
jgi:outer membrane lipoprotein-sorting protein